VLVRRMGAEHHHSPVPSEAQAQLQVESQAHTQSAMRPPLSRGMMGSVTRGLPVESLTLVILGLGTSQCGLFRTLIGLFAAQATQMRCSKCGKKVAEVVAVARPRPRSVPKNPH
jgi:hypothetical protein